MPYPSVDHLQRLLSESIFHYAKDSKKAAGRALGTLVEVITFHMLKAWGLEPYTAIERSIPEYGNKDITHNVEYSLHPSVPLDLVELSRKDVPITAKKIADRSTALSSKALPRKAKTSSLLTRTLLLRNACHVCGIRDGFVNAYLESFQENTINVQLYALREKPFSILECKRVGVEEGTRKGPQTIEKAKQGAYVARAVSSLQKIRLRDGTLAGIISQKDGSIRCGQYMDLLKEMIASDQKDLLTDFILTVGVVSNHGNWFTSENHNKELKVLAQSYDWLLFLTDKGLSDFINDLLLQPNEKHTPLKQAFAASYTGEKGVNRFTKVRMDLTASLLLQGYFDENLAKIESWFNIISPQKETMAALKTELETLARKDWNRILS